MKIKMNYNNKNEHPILFINFFKINELFEIK